MIIVIFIKAKHFLTKSSTSLKMPQNLSKYHTLLENLPLFEKASSLLFSLNSIKNVFKKPCNPWNLAKSFEKELKSL
jgi:hypothetical protein